MDKWVIIAAIVVLAMIYPNHMCQILLAGILVVAVSQKSSPSMNPVSSSESSDSDEYYSARSPSPGMKRARDDDSSMSEFLDKRGKLPRHLRGLRPSSRLMRPTTGKSAKLRPIYKLSARKQDQIEDQRKYLKYLRRGGQKPASASASSSSSSDSDSEQPGPSVRL